ncbi:MAG: endonuclease III [Candidatus Omnitrophica bacterium]|nr:endonuclease III [Candidatus Omnitrophota bacterium]
MNNKYVRIFKLIERQVKGLNVPWVTKVSDKDKDPYKVLISCILSLRTKDKTTAEASGRLFAKVSNPGQMLKLSGRDIARLIYPVGFYRNKAKVILSLSKDIIDTYKGKVPSSLEKLLGLKGVGRKTANLVLGLSYGVSSICVDTHVHRISNRLGWVATKKPLETEQELMKIMPEKYWIRLNTVFVAFGQNICLPVSPFCGKCRAKKLCPRKKVERHR